MQLRRRARYTGIRGSRWCNPASGCQPETLRMEIEEEMGTDLNDLLGTDALEDTAEGIWATTEDVCLWVVGQDGMTFGSGWQSGHDEPGG